MSETRIEPCESWGKHVLQARTKDGWVTLHTDYLVVVQRIQKAIEAAEQFAREHADQPAKDSPQIDCPVCDFKPTPIDIRVEMWPAKAECGGTGAAQPAEPSDKEVREWLIESIKPAQPPEPERELPDSDEIVFPAPKIVAKYKMISEQRLTEFLEQAKQLDEVMAESQAIARELIACRGQLAESRLDAELQRGRADSYDATLDHLEAEALKLTPYPEGYRPVAWEAALDLPDNLAEARREVERLTLHAKAEQTARIVAVRECESLRARCERLEAERSQWASQAGENSWAELAERCERLEAEREKIVAAIATHDKNGNVRFTESCVYCLNTIRAALNQ